MRAIRAVSGRLLTTRSHAPLIFVAALASFFVAPAVASASLSWGAPVAVNTAGGQPTPAVACPSTSLCTAVDASGRAVKFNPTSPGTPTSTPIDGSNQLNAVVCTSTTSATR